MVTCFSVRLISGEKRMYQLIRSAKIQFLDNDGVTLAEGKSDNRHGTVYVYHPEVGYCVEEESKTPYSSKDRHMWYDCYDKQSKWIINWIRNVKYVDVEFETCVLKKIPVSVSESKGDWWLWWVPHPHIGGKPSTYFRITIEIDKDKCTVF